MCLGLAGGYREEEKENKKERERLSLLKPFTNADKLKAMPNDELVNIISDSGFFDCKFCAFHYDDTCNAECQKGFKQWLESEVK